MKSYFVSAVALTSNALSQLAVRKLKKKDALKSVGKWECEVGQDWSARSNIETEGISESVDNVSVHCFTEFVLLQIVARITLNHRMCNWKTWQLQMHCNLKAARCRASHSELFLANFVLRIQ